MKATGELVEFEVGANEIKSLGEFEGRMDNRNSQCWPTNPWGHEHP